jgi:hypothetical protein
VPELGDDRCGLCPDPLLGVANRALPGEREPNVLLTVGLHVASQAMPLAAVDLDHEPVGGPVEVDEFAGDDHVRLRLGQVGLTDQREQIDLSGRAQVRDAVAEIGQRRRERRKSVVAADAFHELPQLGEVALLALGHFERIPHASDGDLGGEVKRGSCP